jgi:hypothetical protein
VLVSQVLLRLIYTFVLAYGTSFGPVGWILPGEVFPVSSRSRGVTLATASNWINNCKCISYTLLFRTMYLYALAVLIGLVTPVFMDISAPYAVPPVPSLTPILNRRAAERSDSSPQHALEHTYGPRTSYLRREVSRSRTWIRYSGLV